jgi:hypothetical protein
VHSFPFVTHGPANASLVLDPPIYQDPDPRKSLIEPKEDAAGGFQRREKIVCKRSRFVIEISPLGLYDDSLFV